MSRCWVPVSTALSDIVAYSSMITRPSTQEAEIRYASSSVGGDILIAPNILVQENAKVGGCAF